MQTEWDGQAVAMLPTDRKSYGGFWIRVGAYVVDFVVLLIPSLLVSFLYRATVSPAKDHVEEILIDLVDACLGFVLSWIYTAVLLSSAWQATVGKKVCGLKVVGHQGNRISFGRATGRYFASWLSGILLGIGFLMIAWTSKRQGLHDLIAETFVVRVATDGEERTA
jgi:uncharacterized RDD family membrane protein YckC